MDLKDLYEVFKKIGFYNILMIIGKISWFFFPFLLWWKLYLLYPMYFDINILYIIGCIVVFIVFFWAILFDIELISYDERIKDSITRVNISFNDPLNQNSDKIIREECKKFVVPYIYSNKLLPTGLSNFFNIRSYKMVLIEMLIYVYLSISVISIIVYFKNNIFYLLSNIVNLLPYIKTLFYIIQYNYNYILFNLFSLSILSCIFLSLYISGYTFNKKILFIYVISEFIFPLPYRLWIISEVFLYLIHKNMEKKYVRYTPFIFPSNLPSIIYQAANNIGLKNPKISKFEYNVKSVEDVNYLKRIIINDKHISGMFKTFIKLVNEQAALNSILYLDPEFILCLSDSTCHMHGSIIYDPSIGVRKSSFYFDNQFFKEEFIKIADTEIAEQRKMKPLIPSDLNSLLDRAKGKGDDEFV